MAKINVISLFRESQIFSGRFINQVPRFFNQLAQQRLVDNVEIGKVICVYTPSEDNTLESLKSEKEKGRFDIDIITKESTFGEVRSTVHKDRLKELSACGDAGLELAKEDADYIYICESDLCVYDIFLLSKLYLSFGEIDKLGIIAPLIFLDTNYRVFYDSFIYTGMDGSKWRNEYPWSSTFNDEKQYLQMLSVGSCTLVKADLIRDGVRFRDNAYLNLCKEIREKDHKVYCDKRLFIYHPSQILHNGRWS